jgi:hypothetical protein
MVSIFYYSMFTRFLQDLVSSVRNSDLLKFQAILKGPINKSFCIFYDFNSVRQ